MPRAARPWNRRGDARTSRSWTHTFDVDPNNLNNLRRQNRPIPDTGVRHSETCRRMPSSIPHGGRPYTVQRRGVDAGEREEPGQTMPVGREFIRGRGRLASTSPADVLMSRGTMAEHPWPARRRLLPRGPGRVKNPAARPGRCIDACRGRGIREPSSSTGSSGNRDAKPRGASRVPGPSIWAHTTASQADHTGLSADACPTLDCHSGRSPRT